MAEPRTAAGRALLAYLNSTDRGWYRSEILAIEAEAAGAALTAGAIEVLRSFVAWGSEWFEEKKPAELNGQLAALIEEGAAILAALPATPPADPDGVAPCAVVGTFMDVPQLCGEPPDSPWHDRPSEFFKHDYRAAGAGLTAEPTHHPPEVVTNRHGIASRSPATPPAEASRSVRRRVAVQARDEPLRLLRALVTDVQKEGSEWITSPSWSVLREARAYLAAHAEDATDG